MSLDQRSSGVFHQDDLSWNLSEIQRNTVANNKVKAQMEYALKEGVVQKIPSNVSQITKGSEIVFNFDKSYLANSSYLNRCKTRTRVKLVLPLTNLAYNPTAASNYVLAPNANAGQRGTQVNNHGWDPLNCALAPFTVNKALSIREINFSGKSIQSQSFVDQNEVDELACMFNQDSLETLGIYPEKTRGVQALVGNVYGTGPSLGSFYDQETSLTVDYANNVEYLMKQPFWKRNSNGKYYWMVRNEYKNGTTSVGGYTYERVGTSIRRSGVLGTPANTTGDGAATNPLCPNPQLNLTQAGVTAITAGETPAPRQEIEFIIEEDLISDLFCNVYQDRPRYFAMNSAELNFRFQQSGNLNALFKTSSPNIGDPVLSLETMELEFYTFNLGTVQVPFDNFEIPFFLQSSQREVVNVVAGAVAPKEIPVISYSTIPHYIKIDLFQDADPTEDWEFLGKNLQITDLSLQVDSDLGNSLQQMSMQDLMVRTIKNLGNFHQTWEQVYYPMPNPAQTAAVQTGTTYAANYLYHQLTSQAAAKNSSAPILPFILLRMDEDIRLASGLSAGMRERINCRFKIGASNCQIAGTAAATVKITGYTCGKYIVSPINGLLDTVEVSYSRTEWMRNITAMNASLAAKKANNTLPKHVQKYRVPDSMVMGGSWFSALASTVGPVLGAVKDVARAVEDVADKGSVAQKVASTTHDVLSKMGMGNRRVKYV